MATQSALETAGSEAVQSKASRRPNFLTRHTQAKIASIPMFLVVLGVFIGGSIWTIVYSFTKSASLPRHRLRRVRAV